MVKSPVVFVAGSLRTAGQGIDRDSWTWMLEAMGQYPFQPPSVAGWDWGPAWLSSNSMRVRFDFANYLLDTPARGRGGRLHAQLAVAETGAGARPPRGRRPVDLARSTDRELLRIARRRARRRGLRRARATCASACCATC